MERFFGSVKAVDGKLVGGIESRREKGEPLNVVPMGMSDEDVAADGPLLKLAEKRQSQDTNSGAGIQNQQLIAAAHFGAGGVATIFIRRLSGRRHGTARAPESNRERSLRFSSS